MNTTIAPPITMVQDTTDLACTKPDAHTVPPGHHASHDFELTADDERVYTLCNAVVQLGPATAEAIGEALHLIDTGRLYRSQVGSMLTYFSICTTLNPEEGFRVLHEWRRMYGQQPTVTVGTTKTNPTSSVDRVAHMPGLSSPVRRDELDPGGVHPSPPTPAPQAPTTPPRPQRYALPKPRVPVPPSRPFRGTFPAATTATSPATPPPARSRATTTSTQFPPNAGTPPPTSPEPSKPTTPGPTNTLMPPGDCPSTQPAGSQPETAKLVGRTNSDPHSLTTSAPNIQTPVHTQTATNVVANRALEPSPTENPLPSPKRNSSGEQTLAHPPGSSRVLRVMSGPKIGRKAIRGTKAFVGDPLRPEEEKELAEREKRIADHERAVFSFAEDLRAIRDKKLYRALYRTFQAYLGRRWGWTRARAYQLIDAAQVNSVLSTQVDICRPTNERQLRPLVLFKPEEQVLLWRKAVDQADGAQPSPANVRTVVKDYVATKGAEGASNATAESTPSPKPPFSSAAAWGKIEEFLDAQRESWPLDRVSKLADNLRKYADGLRTPAGGASA